MKRSHLGTAPFHGSGAFFAKSITSKDISSAAPPLIASINTSSPQNQDAGDIDS